MPRRLRLVEGEGGIVVPQPDYLRRVREEPTLAVVGGRGEIPPRNEAPPRNETPPRNEPPSRAEAPSRNESPPRPTLAQIADVFLRYSNFTFGGGNATIAVVRAELSDKRGSYNP